MKKNVYACEPCCWNVRWASSTCATADGNASQALCLIWLPEWSAGVRAPSWLAQLSPCRVMVSSRVINVQPLRYPSRDFAKRSPMFAPPPFPYISSLCIKSFEVILSAMQEWYKHLTDHLFTQHHFSKKIFSKIPGNNIHVFVIIKEIYHFKNSWKGPWLQCKTAVYIMWVYIISGGMWERSSAPGCPTRYQSFL